jgi:hypothetical protein
MFTQPEKQINKDWTIKEWRNPRKNDVVIDTQGEVGIVTVTHKTDGFERNLTIENIDGEVIYENVSPKSFSSCSHTQTREFFLQYKDKKGWKRGYVYKLVGKDVPLLLIDMEYSFINQEMLYVFKNLSSSEKQYFKTSNEKLLEHLEVYQEIANSAFIEDDTCSLRYKAEFNLVDKGKGYHEKWSVSGSAVHFGEIEVAQEEILRWVAKMKIRRLASVLSKMPKGIEAEIAITEDNEIYAKPFSHMIGQPAIFNSLVSAGIAINSLNVETWKLALQSDIDNYMMR